MFGRSDILTSPVQKNPWTQHTLIAHALAMSPATLECESHRDCPTISKEAPK